MLLKDFYRDTVEMNDNKTGGWSTYYYGVFSTVINENNFKNVAEVGIGYGTHAKEVLKNTSVEKIHLVDPMRFYENDGFAEDIISREASDPNVGQFDELYSLIQNELSPYNDRITWHRTTSNEVTGIAEGSLDAVFLDADKGTEPVLSYLNFWWGKLRSGGMLLGDDYWIDTLAKAVDMFAEQIGQPVTFKHLPGSDYYIYCFTKP